MSKRLKSSASTAIPRPTRRTQLEETVGKAIGNSEIPKILIDNDKPNETLALEIANEMRKALDAAQDAAPNVVTPVLIDRLFGGRIEIASRCAPVNCTLKRAIELLGKREQSVHYWTSYIRAHALRSQLEPEVGRLLSLSHYRVLLGVLESADQKALAVRAVKEGLSKSDLESEVRKRRSAGEKKSPSAGRPPLNPFERLAKAMRSITPIAKEALDVCPSQHLDASRRQELIREIEAVQYIVNEVLDAYDDKSTKLKHLGVSAHFQPGAIGAVSRESAMPVSAIPNSGSFGTQARSASPKGNP